MQKYPHSHSRQILKHVSKYFKRIRCYLDLHYIRHEEVIMSIKVRYPRDMQGYGAIPPAVNWPRNASVCVQFVINYEEGGENCLLHGDSASEAFLSEIIGAQPWEGQRHWNMESIYEYGARAGFWRLHRLFTDLVVPVTVYGVATALQRGPAQVAAMLEAGWEIASHGLKWIESTSHGGVSS